MPLHVVQGDPAYPFLRKGYSRCPGDLEGPLGIPPPRGSCIPSSRGWRGSRGSLHVVQEPSPEGDASYPPFGGSCDES